MVSEGLTAYGIHIMSLIRIKWGYVRKKKTPLFCQQNAITPESQREESASGRREKNKSVEVKHRNARCHLRAASHGLLFSVSLSSVQPTHVCVCFGGKNNRNK